MFFSLCEAMAITGLFQVYKYATNSPKTKHRLVNIVLIALILVLTYLNPLGLIDFEKFEGENLLYATYEGTANCSISIRLKEEDRTSISYLYNLAYCY
jgi:hypothetical protein